MDENMTKRRRETMPAREHEVKKRSGQGVWNMLTKAV